MHSLPLFVTIKDQPVILIGTGEAAEAKRRLILRAGGLPVGEDDPQAAAARLAFIALDDDAESSDAAARLRQRGLLVNVVDRPALCDFTTPAIVDRDPVLIAVGTGGSSAGLAKAIRQRIEALLPPGIGLLAETLFQARAALRARWPDAGARRRALDAALAPGGTLDPLRAARNEDAVDLWLGRADDVPADRVEVVRLVSLDPDDLTLRAARLLGEADRIVHPLGIPANLLIRARADATRLILPADALLPAAAGLTVRLELPSST